MRKLQKLDFNVIAVMIICYIILAPPVAIACGPPHPTPEQNIAEAEAVFYGQVKEVQELNILWGLGHLFDTRIEVEISRSWKGMSSTAVHIYGGLFHNGPSFENTEVDDEYLFLLRQEDDGAWVVANQPCGSGMVYGSDIYKYLPQLENNFEELSLQLEPIPFIWPMHPIPFLLILTVLLASFWLISFVIGQICKFVVWRIKSMIRS